MDGHASEYAKVKGNLPVESENPNHLNITCLYYVKAFKLFFAKSKGQRDIRVIDEGCKKSVPI